MATIHVGRDNDIDSLTKETKTDLIAELRKAIAASNSVFPVLTEKARRIAYRNRKHSRHDAAVVGST